MARLTSRPRRSALAPAVLPTPRPRNVADAEHTARADSEIVSAVAAVDAWYEAGAVGEGSLDLTDSCMAAVDAATARAQDLGVTCSRASGRRVVLKLRAPSSEPS